MTLSLEHRPTLDSGFEAVPVQLIDCDVHVEPKSRDELLSYLAEPWRSRNQRADRFQSGVSLYLPPRSNRKRMDAFPPSGGPPGSDPEFMRQQLFGESAIDYAVLIPVVAHARANEDEEAAMAAAQNQWLADTWLSKYNQDGRFFGSITVCPRNVRAAVDEIEHWASVAKFIQVLIYVPSAPPLGHPMFWPIYEAAARHGLPIALHTNSSTSMNRLSPVGFPSHYLDQRITQWITVATHLTSFVFEGVFEQVPDLKIVLVEAGILWLLPMMWRMDNYWTELGGEGGTPSARPSESVRQHVRLTTQPFEAGPGHGSPRRIFHRMLHHLQGERLLMFGTDYPHWDGDYRPTEVLERLPGLMRQPVAVGNALSLYRLPPQRTQRVASGV